MRKLFWLLSPEFLFFFELKAQKSTGSKRVCRNEPKNHFVYSDFDKQTR